MTHAKQSHVSQTNASPTLTPAVDRTSLHPILRLQRSVGNRVVGTMLQPLKLGSQRAPTEHTNDSSAHTAVCETANKSPICEGECENCQIGTSTTSNGALTKMSQSISSTSAVLGSLSLSSPTDPAELEAERVATEIMGIHNPLTRARSSSLPAVERRIGVRKEEEKLHRSESGTTTAAVPPIVYQALNSPGHQLPGKTQDFFELRFGHDFSNVRVHTDETAARSAQVIQARAFTYGQDLVFGAGEYAPGTPSGDLLIAHELAHVQQHIAPFSPFGISKNLAKLNRWTNPIVSLKTDKELLDSALKDGDVAALKQVTDFSSVSLNQVLQLIDMLNREESVWGRDARAMKLLWSSIGADFAVVANKDGGTRWKASFSKVSSLSKDVPEAKAIKDQFPIDVKAQVTHYLTENRQFVLDETARLGLTPDERTVSPQVQAKQADEIQNMQVAASLIAELQKAQEMVRGNLLVGYEPADREPRPSIIGGNEPSQPSFTTPLFNPVFFDPFRKPPLERDPESDLFAGNRPIVTPYDTVKQKYDEASATIEAYLKEYPALYAISREGKSADTESFSKVADPAAARKQLGDAMRNLFKDIEGTQIKIDGGDLNPLDLAPIHDQLLRGVLPPSQTNWKKPLEQSLARDIVKDHQFETALKALALQSAAQALFMFAPLTGGASIYVLLAGLAATGAKLYLSTEHYEALALAAKSSPKPGTALVAPSQVDEAKMAMEADRIAFALAALTVATGIGLKSISAIKDFRTKLELRRGAAAIRSNYLEKPFPKGNVATAKLALEDGNEMGFGETSRQKSPLVRQPPIPKSAGGQFEPSADPNKNGAIANTDPEYKILTSAADVLEKQYGVSVKGKLYLYSERELCISCNDVLSQFKMKFPNIEVKVFSDYPYP